VDLWDLTRLIVRRWYFTVPVLLVTLVGVLIASRTVQPDYSASGHLQLVPPATREESAAVKATRVHNPWLDLGVVQLGQAEILKVQDQRVLKELVAGGYSDNVVITIDYPTTYFSIEVIGTSPQQATNTVKKVMSLLSRDVEDEQKQIAGVSPEDFVTTIPLDHGDKVTVVKSKVIRVIIVGAGIGLLTTFAFTIGMDALLRRRARRQGGPAEQSAEAAGPLAGGPVNGTANGTAAVPVQRVNGDLGDAAAAAVRRASVPAAAASVPGTTASAPVPSSRTGKVFRSKASEAGETGPIVVAYHQTSERRPDDVEAIGPDGARYEVEVVSGPLQVPSDATIVLPLSHNDWAARDNGSKQR